MRGKTWAVLAVAVLVAAAFFLPELLLEWGDRQLLDAPHMDARDEAREGFAESIQLTVPEKLFLLRSGTLTVMELDQEVLTSATFTDENGEAMVNYFTAGGEVKLQTAEEFDVYLEEAHKLWADRLDGLRGEIASLQTLGGLPELWLSGSDPDFSTEGDFLYLDPDTRLNFQVYQVMLLGESYSLDLLVDVDSGRILSLELYWNGDSPPNWGSRGASNFGSAWRDYWRMDSVSTGWYNEYTRGILEIGGVQTSNSGDYAAHDQITYMYDGQSLSVPLDCRGVWSRYIAVSWNR